MGQIVINADNQYAEILTGKALDFLVNLDGAFENRRQQLLHERAEVQARLDKGWTPGLRDDETSQGIRHGDWTIGTIPQDLLDRRVEITGPTDRKMIINALNSGARVFMADFEDANSPTWSNMVEGQQNLIDAIERRISFTAENGKIYQLNPKVATLVVRPRGWHLVDRHLMVNGHPVSGSLMDFGLYVFHNAHRLLQTGSGPYFYLPKLEGFQEAQLWDDVFSYAEDALSLRRGTIKASILIETIFGALEMEEMLYAMKDHVVALNAGRWDYIFSIIKKFRAHPTAVLPDRHQVTMTVPFMRAYATHLVEVCHRHGAMAIGGMAAFIPSRRDVEVNRKAIALVQEDKEREATDGFDGTWVAHPDLVPVAMKVFDQHLGDRRNQLEESPVPLYHGAADLLDFAVPGGQVTEAGIRNNIQVTLRYVQSWLGGVGAVAIFNLMEDAATAEIARSQIWQWIHYGVSLSDGRLVTADLVGQMAQEEHQKLLAELNSPEAQERLNLAFEVFRQASLDSTLVDFLTLIAYEKLS